MVKTASGTGLIPCQGRSHMPKGAAQTNKKKFSSLVARILGSGSHVGWIC